MVGSHEGSLQLWEVLGVPVYMGRGGRGGGRSKWAEVHVEVGHWSGQTNDTVVRSVPTEEQCCSAERQWVKQVRSIL